jgi:hypothetical protein
MRIDRHPTIGWSTTTVPVATAAAYAAEVEQLRAAIVHVRGSEHRARHAGPGGPPDGEKPGADQDTAAGAGARSAPRYVCGCQPRQRLRMARTVYALADVVCGESFTADSQRVEGRGGG